METHLRCPWKHGNDFPTEKAVDGNGLPPEKTVNGNTPDKLMDGNNFPPEKAVGGNDFPPPEKAVDGNDIAEKKERHRWKQQQKKKHENGCSETLQIIRD